MLLLPNVKKIQAPDFLPQVRTLDGEMTRLSNPGRPRPSFLCLVGSLCNTDQLSWNHRNEFREYAARIYAFAHRTA